SPPARKRPRRGSGQARIPDSYLVKGKSVLGAKPLKRMENFMRSSEASGAGAFGFRVGMGKYREQLSSGLAIAAIALLGAALFVAYDASRTFELLEISEYSRWDSFFGLAGRGAAALVLACALIVLATRQRPPASGRRDDYRQLASAIPMGLACWTRSGRLIVCNENYRRSLGAGGADPDYREAIGRLVSGGEMRLLCEDERSRLLELSRPDGTCLLIEERPLGEGNFVTLVTDITERKRADAMLGAIRQEQRLLARRYHEEKLKA